MAGLENKTAEEIEALATLAQNLASNPKTRLAFLGLTKQSNPDASIPEIDIPQALQRQFAEPLAKLDALQKKAEERELKDRIEAGRNELRAKGVTDAEIPKLEKLMTEKGIANHDTALEHMRLQDRMAEPTPSTTGGARQFTKPTMPDLKAFNGDMKAFTYDAAYKAIDELRGRRSH